MGLSVEMPVFMAAFADGEQGEEVPEAVPVADVEAAVGVADEEAPQGRLDHVLGVQLLADARVEPLPGQADQPPGKALDHVAGGHVVASTQPGHQIRERGRLAHAHRFPRPTVADSGTIMYL